MTDHADGWMLAIDFGTSNTAAAIRSGATNEVLELSRGSRTMPSGVILDTSDGPRVGEMAERLRALHPHTYEENPKNLVGMTPQMYGGRPVHGEEFVAEIFREVRRIALDRKAGVEPAKVVFTHPSAWGGVKTQQLRRAAERAGFDRRTIELVEEPIAAAHHFRHESTGQPIPIGGHVLVFDFGGGTLDLALVEHTEAEEFEVKDIEAIENLGGNNLDEALWGWTLAQIEARHPDAVAHLRSSEGRREEATLRDYVRRAKEDLSFRPATEIPVMIAGYDETYRPTAEEYEALIRPLVERAVTLTRTLLDRNDDSKVVKFYLTGGSSLTPLVARALAQATGITPTRLGDPKTVVVDGALSAVAAAGAASAPPAEPVHIPEPPVTPVLPDNPTGITTRLEDPKTEVVNSALSPVTAATAPPAQPTEPVIAAPPVTPLLPDQPMNKTNNFPGSTPLPATSYAESTSNITSVRWAYTGAALLCVSGVLLFLAFSVTSETVLSLLAIGLLFQAGAMAALSAHHLTRPSNEVRRAAYIYGGSIIISLVMASTINNLAIYFFAHVLFGLCLVVIGVRLMITARQSTGRHVRSLRAPAPWVIAAGASYILPLPVSLIESVMVYASPNGDILLQWMWPAAVVAMAAAYMISAVRLKRELENKTVISSPNDNDSIDTSRA